MTRFYLPDEQRKIRELASAQLATEDEVAPAVISASYDTVGMEVAKHWNFSDNIVYCMNKVPLYKLTKPKTDMETIRCLVIFSNKLCELINKPRSTPEEWKKALNTFKHRFDTCFTSDAKTITDVIEGAFNELKSYCDNFNLNLGHSHFLDSLALIVKGQEGVSKEKKHPEPGVKSPMQILDSLLDSEEEGAEILTPEDILTKGILEIANALLESFSLNDILRMILEVLYRGMEFTRIVIGIRSSREPYMEGRFGFGQSIDKLVKGFRFQVEKTSEDVFNISLSKDSIVLINNVYDVEVQSCIPSWLRTIFNAQTFIVIPITLRKAPIAIIYGDWTNVDPQALHPKRLRYVKTLRNQAMLAIKHSM
ncbi:MAG: GAF domain-containing protein [Nitrospirae bacterium]|nr:GAF domain-containing protein [Nitrospirota bacterium]